MNPQRLIVTFKPEEIIMSALYRTQDGAGPNTKAGSGGYGTRQDRPHASPGRPRGRRRVCGYFGIHYE